VAASRLGVSAPADEDRVVVTRSADETRSLGARLAAVARAGDVVALFGGLGAGKTELAKGFATGLGVRDVVNSPTFVLMAEHAGRLPLFHLDLYRLSGPDDVVAAGLMDERRAGGVTVIEWADRMGSLLPTDHLAVTIDGSGDLPRTLSLRAGGPEDVRYLEAVDGGSAP
jgi:tRNA threonylcarbamoyladenosine biosynthesis protein TsaE